MGKAEFIADLKDTITRKEKRLHAALDRGASPTSARFLKEINNLYDMRFIYNEITKNEKQEIKKSGYKQNLKT